MPDFPPAHPGEILREDFLQPLGMIHYALAKGLAVPEIRISEVVNGKQATGGKACSTPLTLSSSLLAILADGGEGPRSRSWCGGGFPPWS